MCINYVVIAHKDYNTMVKNAAFVGQNLVKILKKYLGVVKNQGLFAHNVPTIQNATISQVMPSMKPKLEQSQFVKTMNANAQFLTIRQKESLGVLHILTTTTAHTSQEVSFVTVVMLPRG